MQTINIDTGKDALYAEPDLHRAADQSAVRPAWHDRLEGARNAIAIALDVAGRRIRSRPRPAQEVTVVGSDALEDDGITAAYAGSGINRDWCLSTVFARHQPISRSESATQELAEALERAAAEVSVLFAEGIPESRLPQAGTAFLTMPAWVKQRLRVQDDWSRQLAGLRREVRQEISRILRKYGYTCRLSRHVDDHVHFYESLYGPWITKRFGGAAHVVNRAAFLEECSRGTLLQLLRDDTVLGAALLRPVGRTLAVVWSALDPGRGPAGLRGATDAMDYFSLLYAHLKRYRWLDLGPSRPDLLDGALRYKSKWGCELHKGRVPQAEIRWTFRHGDGRTPVDFLTRHVFLVKNGNGLRALFFVDGGIEPEALRSRLAAARTKGVSDYRVVCLTPPAEALRQVADGCDGDVALMPLQDLVG